MMATKLIDDLPDKPTYWELETYCLIQERRMKSLRRALGLAEIVIALLVATGVYEVWLKS